MKKRIDLWTQRKAEFFCYCQKVYLRITYYLDTDRARDKDNYIPKSMNGLKKSGVIRDDNNKVVNFD